jgi:hypothetical protein
MLQDLGRSATSYGHWKHEFVACLMVWFAAIACDCMYVAVTRKETQKFID